MRSCRWCGIHEARQEAAERCRSHWEDAFLREEAARLECEREQQRYEAWQAKYAGHGDATSQEDETAPGVAEGEFAPPPAWSFGRGSRPSERMRAPGRANFNGRGSGPTFTWNYRQR